MRSGQEPRAWLRAWADLRAKPRTRTGQGMNGRKIDSVLQILGIKDTRAPATGGAQPLSLEVSRKSGFTQSHGTQAWLSLDTASWTLH